MSYRAAIIGCGKIGSELADDPCIKGVYSHAGAYASCPETALVAVCDSDQGKLDRCAERWKVEARYRDPQRMLAEERPDIVSICTPDSTHNDLIRTAIATLGVRAILTEKPLALGLAAAHELVRLASERNIVLAVNYSRRYANNHVWLKEFLETGGIGAIQTISGYYTKGTLHNGTHWFDLARFLVGEVSRVWGFDVLREDSPDPTLDAFLEFDSGASAHLHGCDAKAFTLFEMDLMGTRGRVRALDSGHTLELHDVVDSPHYTGYRTLAQKDRLEDGLDDVLLHAVEDVVRCLNEGGQPRCSGVDGIAALEVALAVRESARLGHPMILGHAA